MSNSISDVQSDVSFKVFHNKLQGFTEDAREFIKTASIDYDELSSLPTTAFAWPEMRKFAMHNKEHAALSMIYSHGESVPSHVTQNLEKAASLYDISLKEVPLTKVASSNTTPIVSGDYLLPQEKMCKVASASDIELGVEFLKRNGQFMGVMKLAHANKVLCKKASELNVNIPMKVYKEAGLVKCNLEKLGEWLETRAVVAKETKHKVGYEKLAQVVSPSSKEPITRNTLLKVATTIAILDEDSGISSKYRNGIETPMSSVFNTEKVAEETMYFGGQNIPVSSFAKLDEDIYSQVLGDDVVNEITTDGNIDYAKVMDIMHTLPADLQQALVPYLTDI